MKVKDIYTELSTKSVVEAVNKDNAEVNAMIRDTLKTKSDKTPKYYDELTAMGYTLTKDAPSTYNYWGIEGPGRMVVVSKGDKRGLYSGGYGVTSVLSGDKYKERKDKVDYKNLLDKKPNTTYKHLKYSNSRSLSKVNDLRSNKWNAEFYDELAEDELVKIQKLKLEIDKLEKSVDKYRQQAEDSRAKSVELLTPRKQLSNK